jgi:hypothetical protein
VRAQSGLSAIGADETRAPDLQQPPLLVGIVLPAVREESLASDARARAETRRTDGQSTRAREEAQRWLVGGAIEGRSGRAIGRARCGAAAYIAAAEPGGRREQVGIAGRLAGTQVAREELVAAHGAKRLLPEGEELGRIVRAEERGEASRGGHALAHRREPRVHTASQPRREREQAEDQKKARRDEPDRGAALGRQVHFALVIDEGLHRLAQDLGTKHNPRWPPAKQRARPAAPDTLQRRARRPRRRQPPRARRQAAANESEAEVERVRGGAELYTTA